MFVSLGGAGRDQRVQGPGRGQPAPSPALPSDRGQLPRPGGELPGGACDRQRSPSRQGQQRVAPPPVPHRRVGPGGVSGKLRGSGRSGPGPVHAGTAHQRRVTEALDLIYPHRCSGGVGNLHIWSFRSLRPASLMRSSSVGSAPGDVRKGWLSSPGRGRGRGRGRLGDGQRLGSQAGDVCGTEAVLSKLSSLQPAGGLICP